MSSIISVSKAFENLPPSRREEVSSDILTGAIIYYLNKDSYTIYFKRKANCTIGAKRKIFEFLATLSREAVDRLCATIIEN